MKPLSKARHLLVPIVALILVVGLWPAATEANDLREAKRTLQEALQQKDAGALKQVFRELAAADSEEAAKLLVGAGYAARDLDVYEELVDALSQMKSKGAVRFLSRLARKHREWAIRYLVGESLARNGSPEAVEGFLELFEDKQPEVVIMAARTARKQRIKAAIPAMIERLEQVEKRQPDSTLREELLGNLKQMTGKEIESAADFQAWWKMAGANFDPDSVDHDGSEGSSKHSVLRKIHERGEGEFIEELEKGDIVAVTGKYDQVQDVLSALNLPHTVVKREEFADYELDPHSVVIFNCAEKPLPKELVKRVRRFVEMGGYVFSSDWELRNVTGAAFPEYVAVGGQTQEHPDFKIQPGVHHPLLRDVFPVNPFDRQHMTWHIDGMSFPVAVKRPDRVALLVVSSQLKAKYKHPGVAVYFRHGRGAVMHVLSHFYRQKDSSGDGFALQQILLNFVVEKQKWRKKHGKKK